MKSRSNELHDHIRLTDAQQIENSKLHAQCVPAVASNLGSPWCKDPVATFKIE